MFAYTESELTRRRRFCAQFFTKSQLSSSYNFCYRKIGCLCDSCLELYNLLKRCQQCFHNRPYRLVNVVKAQPVRLWMALTKGPGELFTECTPLHKNWHAIVWRHNKKGNQLKKQLWCCVVQEFAFPFTPLTDTKENLCVRLLNDLLPVSWALQLSLWSTCKWKVPFNTSIHMYMLVYE